MSGPEMTEQETAGLVKQIDGKNLQARNCTLDSVRLLVKKLDIDLSPEQEDLIDNCFKDIKHHFGHNRDGIVQVVELVMGGGQIRKFTDGS